MDRDRERVLVARLQQGDPEAFDEIHRTFNVRLFNFLARLSNRREVAEDLLEETWLRLVKHAHRLRPDTHLGAWLFTVARRLHISYCRSRLLEDSRVANLIGLWPHGRPDPSPFEMLENSEASRQIATAFASLPVIYREALLLVVVEEMASSQAAEICEVSPEAMRQRVSRGRTLLARRISDTDMPFLGSLKEIAT